MTRYNVFVADTMIDSFNTREEAESKVAEIIGKYSFINPETVHITEYKTQ